MSFWDDGFKIPNLPAKTMGGKVFWENIEETDEYRLQKNIVFGNCRILRRDDTRVDYGSERAMRLKLDQLLNRTEHAVMGDVICVHRLGGVYDHYGVYADDDHIYEYNLNSDKKRIDIHTVPLSEFTRNADGYSILCFPEVNGIPDKIDVAALKNNFLGNHFNLFDTDEKIGPLVSLISSLKQSGSDYHLYSPEETIERAKSKLGEHDYNLFFNNCEHYAIWCKTGLSESHQIEGLLSKMNDIMVFVGAFAALAEKLNSEDNYD